MTIHRRRLAVVGAVTAALAMGPAGAAFAHTCFIASKPAGAGSAGTATIDVVSGTFMPDDLDTNPQGRLRGGFITLTPTVSGTPIAGPIDTFTHTTLPDGARNSGPGDDMCDGIGIDDAEACLAP